jgi:nucleotide-binding universal stress UspA family protein
MTASMLASGAIDVPRTLCTRYATCARGASDFAQRLRSRDGSALAVRLDMSSLYPRRILVAVDFDESSERAAAVAFELAACCGADVCMMHAVPTDAPAEVGAARRSLERMHGHWQGRPVGIRIETGDPRSSIVQAAEAFGADVIVMGTHARSQTSRGLLGSVAEAVVRSSDVPVLTVRSALPRTM